MCAVRNDSARSSSNATPDDGRELDVQVGGEPVVRLDLVQQLLRGGAAQGVVLHLSSPRPGGGVDVVTSSPSSRQRKKNRGGQLSGLRDKKKNEGGSCQASRCTAVGVHHT